MGTPFPGMDPYLERRGLWEEVHLWLVVMTQDILNAQITPKYRAAILPLNILLHELYDRARYDLVVHYDKPADPLLNAADAIWAETLMKHD